MSEGFWLELARIAAEVVLAIFLCDRWRDHKRRLRGEPTGKDPDSTAG